MKHITREKGRDTVKNITASAAVVEKNVTSNGSDGLDIFKKLLSADLKGLRGRSEAHVIQQIVEAALVSEFGDNIKNAPYYSKMCSVLSKTLSQNPVFRREALVIAQKYAQPKKAIIKKAKKTVKKSKLKPKAKKKR